MLPAASRALLAAVLTGALAIACGSSSHTDAEESNQTSGGRVASHGMVITGSPGAAFISHVPLFEQPHDVQLVASGTITPIAGSQPPPSLADQLFTFLPDVFSLDALRLGTLTTLDGQIFVGSNEHGGRPLPGKFHFTVGKIIHQHVLDAHAPAEPLTYIVFGSRDKTFAVHKIAGAPSFDEVLHVTLSGNDIPTNDQLANGVEVQEGTNTDLVAAHLGATAAAVSVEASGKGFSLAKTSALSCLVSPDFFDPCH
jgi:hypothetical protein